MELVSNTNPNNYRKSMQRIDLKYQKYLQNSVPSSNSFVNSAHNLVLTKSFLFEQMPFIYAIYTCR